jgi:hypothetical protein
MISQGILYGDLSQKGVIPWRTLQMHWFCGVESILKTAKTINLNF